jgi:plasmid stabilization system protein ParE
MGGIVEEFKNPEIREVVVGSHRIVYRYHDNTIEIVSIFHGARILRKKELESD